MHNACPHLSVIPAHTSPLIACPPFNSRQYASVFNQPLSFDTSSVTTMYGMFNVRFSPCCSQSAVEPSHARCLHRRRPPPPAARPAPHPASYALRSTLGSTRLRSTSC